MLVDTATKNSKWNNSNDGNTKNTSVSNHKHEVIEKVKNKEVEKIDQKETENTEMINKNLHDNDNQRIEKKVRTLQVLIDAKRICFFICSHHNTSMINV